MNRNLKIDTDKKPIVNKKMKKTDSFEYYLVKKVGKTIKKYGMIQKGDRIVIGVSGGKDSLTLLKILHQRKGIYPYDYELLALHIPSDMECEGLINTEILRNYFEDHGYPYRIEKMKIKEGSRGFNPFWCSWNRRRMLFEITRRLGYNKLALGHHRNDVIETVLINMFYHGEISTMLPVQSLFEGKITIIRPLYCIPEFDTRKMAELYNFPAVHCRCPVNRETIREFFKRFINEIERMNPKACVNAQRSLENIVYEYLPLNVKKENVDI